MGAASTPDAGNPAFLAKAPRRSGKHAMQPLPFNPSKLKGLSEKLIRSHHENNYGGAVKNLNKVEQQLAHAGKDTPAFVIGGLKERELSFNNSRILHEQYFANLGGNGKPSGPIEALLARTWGSASFGARTLAASRLARASAGRFA